MYDYEEETRETSPRTHIRALRKERDAMQRRIHELERQLDAAKEEHNELLYLREEVRRKEWDIERLKEHAHLLQVGYEKVLRNIGDVAKQVSKRTMSVSTNKEGDVYCLANIIITDLRAALRSLDFMGRFDYF